MQKLKSPKVEEISEDKDVKITRYDCNVEIIEYVSDDMFIPTTCPVCDYAMIKDVDSEYYTKLKCCFDCGIKWAESDIKKWETGWRPSDKDIKKEIKIRNQRQRSFTI